MDSQWLPDSRRWTGAVWWVAVNGHLELEQAGNKEKARGRPQTAMLAPHEWCWCWPQSQWRWWAPERFLGRRSLARNRDLSNEEDLKEVGLISNSSSTDELVLFLDKGRWNGWPGRSADRDWLRGIVHVLLKTGWCDIAALVQDHWNMGLKRRLSWLLCWWRPMEEWKTGELRPPAISPVSMPLCGGM